MQILTTKLQRAHGLSDQDRAALERLPLHEVVAVKGRDIVRASDRTDRCAIILRGMAFSYKLTGEGRRQILGFHLAGDMPNLESLRLDRGDMGVAAMSECHVGLVFCDALNELCVRHPSLADVLWRETLFQAGVIREWLSNIGRRDALTRLAHLICEVVVRHRAAGLTSDYSCDFSLSQAMLADALGISAVHVSRTVQDLRSRSLMDWKGQRLTVLDWERLCDLATFDPAYLRLNDDPLTT